MNWDFEILNNAAEPAIAQGRSVLISEIRVGHVVETPLDSEGQIGLASSQRIERSDADTFVFLDVTDPQVERFVPTLQVTTFSDTATTADTALPPSDDLVAEIAAPVTTPWDVADVYEGRQLLTPANDLLDARLGGRVEGTQLVGSREADALTGTDGDDILIGGRGDDMLTGGAGADVFVFTQSSSGRDTITDFTAGEDVIYFGAETVFDLAEIAITQQGGNTVLSWHRGYSELVLEEFDMNDLDADSFILAAA